MNDYRPPYLIQRIKAAYHNDPLPAGLSSKYSTGQKREDAERRYINDLMPLDYMGSSEFGAVSKALHAICAVREKMSRFTFEVKGKPDSRDYVRIDPKQTCSTIQLYGIGVTEHIPSIVADVFLLAQSRHSPHNRPTKEMVELNESLFGKVEWNHWGKNGKRLSTPKLTLEKSNVTAWLDLTNLWIVGRDKSQMDRIAELLGVEGAAAACL